MAVAVKLQRPLFSMPLLHLNSVCKHQLIIYSYLSYFHLLIITHLYLYRSWLVLNVWMRLHLGHVHIVMIVFQMLTKNMELNRVFSMWKQKCYEKCFNFACYSRKSIRQSSSFSWSSQIKCRRNFACKYLIWINCNFYIKACANT